jgi:Winged helix DNA-binding domain
VVRHLLGVQAQIPTGARLALWARSEGLTEARVDRARLHDRSVVLTWAMRGTLHLVPAEDHGWVVPLVVEAHAANAHRRLRELGVTGDQPARAVRAIERMLARDGPLTRPEVAERLRKLGIRTEGQAIVHLLWLAASERGVCFGPDRGGDRSFVLVRDWIEAPRPRDRAGALAELAVRYLRAHGPATPADLAFWSGLRAADAKRAWGSVEDRLMEVAVPGGRAWALRSARPDFAPAGLIRLLPSFDEYLLGWKDRRYVADPTSWRRINPGGGWYHPAVVADGRAVGTWATTRKRGGLRVEVRSFSRLGPANRSGILAEANGLAAYLGTNVDVAFV